MKLKKKEVRKWREKTTEFGRFKNDNTIVTIVTIQNEMVNIFLRSFGILEGFIFSLPRIFRCISEDLKGLHLDSSSWMQGLEIHGREGGNHTNTKKHEKDIKRLEILFSVIQGSKWCGSDFFFAIKNR